MPPKVITYEALLEQLSEAKKKVTGLQDLPETSSFKHMEFGLLNRDEAARLIEIHTDHHLKIIRDILTSEGIEKMS